MPWMLKRAQPGDVHLSGLLPVKGKPCGVEPHETNHPMRRSRSDICLVCAPARRTGDPATLHVDSTPIRPNEATTAKGKSGLKPGPSRSSPRSAPPRRRHRRSSSEPASTSIIATAAHHSRHHEISRARTHTRKMIKTKRPSRARARARLSLEKEKRRFASVSPLVRGPTWELPASRAGLESSAESDTPIIDRDRRQQASLAATSGWKPPI